MRTEYLAFIALAAFTAGAGLAANSVRGQADFCAQPSAASVTALFAPCQTFDAAMGHVVTKKEKEAVQMGLLTPDEQPALTPEQQLVWVFHFPGAQPEYDVEKHIEALSRVAELSPEQVAHIREQRSVTPEQYPATLVAARLAESVDPFLHRSGG
jgi:hypothetical protein